MATMRISEEIVEDYPEEVKTILNKLLESTDSEDGRSYIKEVLGSIK